MWQALRRLVGNGTKASILIGVFIIVFCGMAWRCSHAAEVDLRAGSSFGPGGEGAVLGLNILQPFGNNNFVYFGTLLWGGTQVVPNNWSWEVGYRTCRGSFCAGLGASYLQVADSVDASHMNFNLEFVYKIGWKRISSIDLTHLSNAGTKFPNQGRNAALVSFRLQ